MVGQNMQTKGKLKLISKKEKQLALNISITHEFILSKVIDKIIF